MENNPSALDGQQIPQTVRMTAKEFAAKFSTKRECFNFLTLDCQAYLPHLSTVTIYFLKDLFRSKKKRILGKDIRHIAIPQYENLTINKILEFVST